MKATVTITGPESTSLGQMWKWACDGCGRRGGCWTEADVKKVAAHHRKECRKEEV